MFIVRIMDWIYSMDISALANIHYNYNYGYMDIVKKLIVANYTRSNKQWICLH